MNKIEFLESLREAMSNAPEATVNDIVYDYSEHIDAALENGELESDIIEKLGDPQRIAKLHGFQKTEDTIKTNTAVKDQRNEKRGVLGRVIVIVGLFFFNLCIALGIFLGGFGVIVGILGAGIGIGVAGVVATFAPFIPEIINVSGNYLMSTVEQTFVTFLGIGLFCMGSLMTIGGIKMLQIFYRLSVRYFNWNIKMIRS